MRPARKARRASRELAQRRASHFSRCPARFDRGATQRAGLQPRPNAKRFRRRCTSTRCSGKTVAKHPTALPYFPAVERNGLRAVFFDAGGTLIAPHPSVVDIYTRALKPLGIEPDPEALRRAYIGAWEEFDALVGPGRDRYSHYPGGEREYWQRYVRRVLQRVSSDERAAEAADALHAAFSDPGAWAVFPEVTRTLSALRERGLRLGVISNWDSRLRVLLSDLGLADRFDTITVSCEVGVEKPHHAIFERALESLGVEPHEALHVGDDPVSDFEGPRAAGMEAAVVFREGRIAAGARAVPAPDDSVTSLSSLEAVLGLIEGRTHADRTAKEDQP